MNKLLEGFALAKTLLVILTFAGFYLAVVMIEYAGTDLFKSSDMSLQSLLLGIILMLILSIYYVVKIIWGRRYLNFEDTSVIYKIIALFIFITAAAAFVGSFSLVEGSGLSEQDWAYDYFMAYRFYMLAIASVSLYWIGFYSKVDSNK